MQCADLLDAEATRTLTVCVASSFHWVLVLSPMILGISATVALLGVLSARSTARQKATLDMIERTESSPHYRDLHRVFSYHRRQDTFSRLHSPAEEKDKVERQAVIDYLNHYELIAIGIRKKILDGGFYQQWMRGAFLRDWNAAAAFIQRERWKWDGRWIYHDRAFENFQHVARLWSAEAVDLNKDHSPPPDRPSGPGDEPLPDARE